MDKFFELENVPVIEFAANLSCRNDAAAATALSETSPSANDPLLLDPT